MVTKHLERTSQKHTKQTEAIRRLRSSLEYEISRELRKAGQFSWTSAEMSALVDDRLRRQAERRLQTASRPSCDASPVQMGLFDTGKESASTRSAAAAEALRRSPTRQAAIERFIIQRGQRGALRDEIAAELQMPIQSVCDPVLALIRAGRIVETQRHRLTRTGAKAVVLVAASYQSEAGQ